MMCLVEVKTANDQEGEEKLYKWEDGGETGGKESESAGLPERSRHADAGPRIAHAYKA
jgi:hypothetical protein